MAAASSSLLAVTEVAGFDYSWVDSSDVAVASCFGFFDGPAVEDVVIRSGMRDAGTEDFRGADSASARASYGKAATFVDAGWTIVYRPDGYPPSGSPTRSLPAPTWLAA
jgi:hypothetical protein